MKQRQRARLLKRVVSRRAQSWTLARRWIESLDWPTTPPGVRFIHSSQFDDLLTPTAEQQAVFDGAVRAALIRGEAWLETSVDGLRIVER